LGKTLKMAMRVLFEPDTAKRRLQRRETRLARQRSQQSALQQVKQGKISDEEVGCGGWGLGGGGSV